MQTTLEDADPGKAERDEEYEIVELDGCEYRITGYTYLKARQAWWAEAEKKIEGEWHEVRNWDLRAELGQFKEGGTA